MTSKGEPIPLGRGWAPPLWEVLSPDERDAMRLAFGLPAGWSPPAEPQVTLDQRLEQLEELGRIMKMPPNRIGQWKEDLIQRVEPEEPE